MLTAPTHVQLEITDHCNLRCQYCYRFNTKQMPKSKDLSNEATHQLVQKMVNAKIYSLIITGGEPLTRPEATIRAVETAKKAGLFVSINTNLLLLTPAMVTKLKGLDINSLLVSCPTSDADIYRQITGCGRYEQLRSKLELLLSSGISCLINMVVTPVNHHLIRKTATDMSKLGIKRFAATPAALNVEYPDQQTLLTKEQIVALLEDLKWCADNLGLEADVLEPIPKCFFPDWCWEGNYAFTKRVCQAGRMSVSVSNTGEVRPCSHNPTSYGNLFQESLEKIWIKMNSYRNNSIPAICKGCPAVVSCNGACRTNALATTGLIDKPDRLTAGHIDWPMKEPVEINISHDSVIKFRGTLRSRSEGKNYSISSKNNGGNLIIVNEEMFRFIHWLEKSSPLSVDELLKNSAQNSTPEALTKILKFLIQKEFVSLA